MAQGSKHTATPWWHALCVLWAYRGARNVTSLRWLLPRCLDKLIFAIVLALIFQVVLECVSRRWWLTTFDVHHRMLVPIYKPRC